MLIVCILVLAPGLNRTIGGAEADTPWAFRPITRPAVPEIDPQDGERVRNPVDAFLLRGLREDGLTPTTEADRRTLIRRLCFDLTGLPPAPAEVDAFLSDQSPDAYEQLVDRLLAAPAYGERWARHWLDLVRFAETHGYERDGPKPDAWRYRDWVVSAFNGDMPYDQFVTHQLAGDEVAGADVASKTATGMYRLGLIDDEPADPLMDRYDQLDDMIRTVGTTFLGLTIHCARCHDHKFDPIPTRDYYRFVALLEPAERYVRDNDSSLSIDLASASEVARVRELNEVIDRRVAELRPKLGELEGDDKADLEARIKELESTRPAPLPMVLGLTDAGPTSDPTHVLRRGDARNLGEAVEPGFLSIIDAGIPAIEPPANAATSGRRLALARWVTSPENPLTARVIVNRLWQHHFGQGLVGTPSDFGAMGEEPLDPELLDWLASELIEQGWSLKALHRIIVSSSAYRRAGTWDDRAGDADPFNFRVWRQPPRRLEGEAIRDAVLAVSGKLNPAMGGPSVRPPLSPEVLATQSRPGDGWKPSEGDEAFRRSLYVFAKRTLPLPELELLDAANTDEPCPDRPVTTTAPQALMLLNGSFWHEQAGHFAARLRSEAGPEAHDQVRLAFRLALSRPPSPTEIEHSIAFLTSQAELVRERPVTSESVDPDYESLRAFCLVLLNCNEFVTVD